jgi:hypothetical protein
VQSKLSYLGTFFSMTKCHEWPYRTDLTAHCNSLRMPQGEGQAGLKILPACLKPDGLKVRCMPSALTTADTSGKSRLRGRAGRPNQLRSTKLFPCPRRRLVDACAQQTNRDEARSHRQDDTASCEIWGERGGRLVAARGKRHGGFRTDLDALHTNYALGVDRLCRILRYGGRRALPNALSALRARVTDIAPQQGQSRKQSHQCAGGAQIPTPETGLGVH